MELNFSSIFLLILLVGIVSHPIKIAFAQKGLTWKSVVSVLGCVLIVVGVLGFIGTMLSSTAGLGRSFSFEWPIGKTERAIKYSNGMIVVPHHRSGRIQIYDDDLQFIRGWHVTAHGGVFEIVSAKNNTFHVFTGRGSMKYHYDLSGKLLASPKYKGALPESNKEWVALSIPTPFYLWFLTHPFAAMLLPVCGTILLFLTGALRHKKTKEPS